MDIRSCQINVSYCVALLVIRSAVSRPVAWVYKVVAQMGERGGGQEGSAVVCTEGRGRGLKEAILNKVTHWTVQ